MKGSSLQSAIQKTSQLVPIGTLVVGIITGAITIGIYVGSIKIIPEKVDTLQASFRVFDEKITRLQEQLNHQVYMVNRLEDSISEVKVKIANNALVDDDQWVAIRDNQFRINNSMTREQFLEWRNTRPR